MEVSNDLRGWLAAWLIMLSIIGLSSKRRAGYSVGLVLIFAFSFSIQHWFGAFIYSLPWYSGTNEYFTTLGFIEASRALIAFAFGSIILGPFLMKIFRFSWLEGKHYIPNLKMPIVYIVTGYTFFFLLRPILLGIASIQTFVFSGWNLMIAGLCLIIWKNFCIKNKKMIVFWLFFAASAPGFTMINSGFLGMGIVVLIIVGGFIVSFYRPVWHIVLGVIIVVYLGFSFYVNYMAVRGQLRQTPVSERAGVLSEMFENFEFFNLTNHGHLEKIEDRLNLNVLTGAAIDYLSQGHQDFAKGAVVKDSLLAFVPRIIWPEKPMRLGGSAIVTKYTGISFAEGTSVAFGLVAELYVNFGTISVLIGFMILGIIIALIDVAAGSRLESGDWKGFIFWFVIGITLMSNTSLAQIVMTAAAAVVFAILINKYIIPMVARQEKDKS